MIGIGGSVSDGGMLAIDVLGLQTVLPDGWLGLATAAVAGILQNLLFVLLPPMLRRRRRASSAAPRAVRATQPHGGPRDG